MAEQFELHYKNRETCGILDTPLPPIRIFSLWTQENKFEKVFHSNSYSGMCFLLSFCDNTSMRSCTCPPRASWGSTVSRAQQRKDKWCKVPALIKLLLWWQYNEKSRLFFVTLG